MPIGPTNRRDLEKIGTDGPDYNTVKDLGLRSSGPTPPVAAFIECGGTCTDFCCAGGDGAGLCLRRVGHRGACHCGG